jgi:hypothetical protein
MSLAGEQRDHQAQLYTARQYFERCLELDLNTNVALDNRFPHLFPPLFRSIGKMATDLPPPVQGPTAKEKK